MNKAVTKVEVDIENDNDHYFETVTNLGEVEDIEASEDVYSQSGILLIKKGVKVNKKIYESLKKHKLKEPIDNSINIGDAITNHELALNYYAQLKQFSLFDHLKQSIQNPTRLKNCLRQVDLNPAMRTKVTVAKKTNPDLYEHALRVSICSVMIGMFMGLNDKDCDILASAGLFHDLGQLHIDPKLLETENVLSAQELNFVYAHPVIIYNQLTAMNAYPKETALAILEHHERIGGNGYPKGINAYSSIYSAILAVTEVLISIADSQPLDRAIIALKTNASKFDTQVMNALFKALLTREKITVDFEKSQEDLKLLESILKERMKRWREIEEEVSNNISISIVNMVYTRMHEFHKTRSRWGLDIENEDLLTICNDNSEAINDVIMLLEEALYIFRDIGREYYRNIKTKGGADIPASITEWISNTMDAISDYKNKNLNIDDVL